MNQEKDIGSLEKNIKIYSIYEITNYLKNLVSKDKNLQDVWVEGEISNFKHHDKKHMYFSLKDEHSLIECVMFQNVNRDLTFMPENGIKVLVRGDLDIYKLKGKFELIISEMHLRGKGELYLKFLQSKAKLEREGLFSEEHKKTLPKYPQSIGIVTSLSGAVIHDMTKIITKRYPHVKIIIYPSVVQGDEAKYSLTKGIDVLNNLLVDVIIIARGGGSFEELWPFNEEIVARKIYNSKIPIMSAVGHESDFTISDFVADKRASTPSAAAEMVVPKKEEIIISMDNLEKRLYKKVKNILETRKQKLNNLISRPLYNKPETLVNEYRQSLDENKIKFEQIFINKLKSLKKDVKDSDGRLNALSPYSVLNRGYSITMKHNKIISSIKNINKEDTILTIVKDGKINSKVKSKNESKYI